MANGIFLGIRLSWFEWSGPVDLDANADDNLSLTLDAIVDEIKGRWLFYI